VLISILKEINRIRYQLFNKIGRMTIHLPALWFVLLFRNQRYRFRALRRGILDNGKEEGQYFNLRRNIHRIEKGLSYQKVKPVFATDYIQQTVDGLMLLQGKHIMSKETTDWAISVLDRYFSIVDMSHEVIAAAYNHYQNVERDNKPYQYYPYIIGDRAESSMSLEDFEKLSLKRRSVRYFESVALDPDRVAKVFDIAKLAPSACNRQSYRYLFYNDKATVDALTKVPGGVSGYELYNVIVILGEYAGYMNERDINAPVIDSSLAAMSFLFACECDGIATVCINWPNLPDREKRIRQIIDIKRSEFVIMMIGLGIPSAKGKIPYSKKRNNKSFLLTNERIKK